MFKLRELNKDEELLNQIGVLYQQVWAQEDQSIQERVIRHAGYVGYRGFVAISSQGEVAGYAYGYSSLPDQYYHRLLSEALNPEEYQTWLTDCFEFVELGVLPAFRNQGLAKYLVNRLLDGTGNKTAVLTTQHDNDSARGLYETLGWSEIKEPFYPNKNGQPYVIIGKHLK